jgi:hypothetical protein
LKTWMKILIGVVVLLIAVPVVTIAVVSESRPEGEQGPAAEALADKMLKAVNAEAWEQVAAVKWRMAPPRPVFLWDRQRGLVQGTVGEGDKQTVVRFSVDKQRYEASLGGEEVTGADAKTMMERAWADFINDSFWLNAPATIRNEDTERAIVKLDDGREGLLVTYGSGGATPGDAYLWLLDDDGRPTAWKMWVGILPVGGLEASWTDWTTLEGGANIARLHEGALGLAIKHDPLEVGPSAAALNGGVDPFGTLLKQGAPPVAAASQPSAPEAAPSAEGTATADGGT